MKIGYARVSTTAQNLDMQIEALNKAGCEKIYTEKESGGNVDEIVDKYVDCKTPELRQQVISGIRQMVGNHMLDNVNIGY